ncbi:MULTISPECIES: hypothetical protein [Algoriphagus]|jgi:hypothetical protein|uniref:Uncharacterized protein n=1 Tax=Algoriphagus aquimarinus TaxID=237018 RepID=A0A5C7AZ60_9BACT|nr:MULTISPECIES: hypothetical protein [Algoriphagus]MDP3200849.1 hypothetical protein [Algoriphagus sp.]TXE14120.1 hypothetical protein ESV85_00755 [Algoriphagus aquimarinus]
MLFEQTAISKKQKETIKSYLEKLKNQDPINPDWSFEIHSFPDHLIASGHLQMFKTIGPHHTLARKLITNCRGEYRS